VALVDTICCFNFHCDFGKIPLGESTIFAVLAEMIRSILVKSSWGLWKLGISHIFDERYKVLYFLALVITYIEHEASPYFVFWCGITLSSNLENNFIENPFCGLTEGYMVCAFFSEKYIMCIL